MLNIRQADASDLRDIINVFVNAIKNVSKRDYTPEQIKAWAHSQYDTQKWPDKIQNQYFIVAEMDQKIVGFASLEKNYLDMMYVHNDYLRRGIATMLLKEIEKEALENHFSGLVSDVSIPAKPFFEKQGFETVKEQKNLRKGVEIINYKMVKKLHGKEQLLQ